MRTVIFWKANNYKLVNKTTAKKYDKQIKATVNAKGVVTAKKKGAATITETVLFKDGFKKTIKVAVKVKK